MTDIIREWTLNSYSKATYLCDSTIDNKKIVYFNSCISYPHIFRCQSSCPFETSKWELFTFIWLESIETDKTRMQFCFSNFWFHQKQDKDKRNENSKLRTLAGSKIDIHLLFILLYSRIKNRKYDTWIRENETMM
jgi:hypothetical protein